MATARRDAGSDLRRRGIVGLALIVLAIVALRFGGDLLWAVASAFALGMLVEWAGLAGTSPWRLGFALLCLAFAMALASPHLWGADRSTVAALAGMALVVGVVTGSGRLGFGLCYAGLPAIGLLFLRGQAEGIWLALWAMVVVWGTDIGAYFAGRRFGGPLLSPRISPKKTWSGLGGGVLAALAGGAIIAVAGGLAVPFRWLGAPLAVLAQAGDLYESALKRRAGVKDSGRLLPGHGGLLDRLDGFVPVVTLVATLVAGGAL